MKRLERYFEFERLGASWRRELLAGFTTFMTMAYIIFVNPSILKETGMPLGAITAATCLASAFGSILMGAYARYPIALAPGMGLNAYFTYTVVKTMGVPWEVALGAVFLSGVIFFVLTLVGVRQLIVSSLPPELYAAVAVGIGLYIALIGFLKSGLIVPSAQTTVTMGNLHDPAVLLSLAGLLVTAALLARRVPGAMIIGILCATALGALAGLVNWQPRPVDFAALGGTFLKLDVSGALRLGLLEIVFAFLFVDMFDNLGTLVAVGKKAGLFTEANTIPRVDRILFSDASATIAGSLLGTSTVVSYIESAAGVVAGGRTGVTAVTTGLLFLAALPLASVVGSIPACATAPALILVGSWMMSHAAEIRWHDPVIAIPAFLTMTTIPLSFSIANGLAFGFTSHTLLMMLSGKARQVSWVVYVLTTLFVLRFVYLGAGA